MLNGLKQTGKYIKNTGLISTLCMAAVGAVSIDIVFLAYLIKKSQENNFGYNNFLTGYMWGTLFTHHHHHDHASDHLILLIASPFLTGIAIGLSFLLGVPQVGICLAIGWGASLMLVGIGVGIIELANKIESYKLLPPPDNAYQPAQSSSYGNIYRQTNSNTHAPTSSCNNATRDAKQNNPSATKTSPTPKEEMYSDVETHDYAAASLHRF